MYMYIYVRISLYIHTGQESARKLEQIKLKLGGGGKDGLAHKTALIHRVLTVWKEGTCAFVFGCVSVLYRYRIPIDSDKYNIMDVFIVRRHCKV